jgi:hypothetical protein
MTLGIDVPTDPEKPAWGPPSGVVLVGPGMLDTDWDLVAEIMGRLDDSDTGELFAAMIPFVMQSHGKVLAYALPESMTPNTTFIAHVQGGGVVKVQSRRRAQAARLYHRLERAGSKTQTQPSVLHTAARVTSVAFRKLLGLWRRYGSP